MEKPVLQRKHSEWRKLAKKFQRKRRRRQRAKQRDEKSAKELQSASHLTRLAEEEALRLIELENIQRQNDEENEKWLRSELLIEQKWREQQRKVEEKMRREEDERNRIAAERAAEVKKKLDLAEEKARVFAEKIERERDLLRRINDYLNDALPIPDELNEIAESNPGKQTCKFFANTATCRFGLKCAWNHCRPKISRTLLVHSFFTNIRLDQGDANEYGADLSLEFDEAQLFRDYCNFFDDALSEFRKFGPITLVVTCQNYESHMRGNVYIEYESPRNAMKAYRDMNGRYYAMRMINIEFCNVSWKAAICGLSMKNRCSKGKRCNFLHIFKNPRNQYPIGDALKRPPPLTEASTTTLNGTEAAQPQNWNEDVENERRNWRWSESPDRQPVVAKTNSTKAPSRNRSRSREASETSGKTKSMSKSSRRSRDEPSDRSDRRHRSRNRHKKSKKRSHSGDSKRKKSKKSKHKSKK